MLAASQEIKGTRPRRDQGQRRAALIERRQLSKDLRALRGQLATFQQRLNEAFELAAQQLPQLFNKGNELSQQLRAFERSESSDSLQRTLGASTLLESSMAEAKRSFLQSFSELLEELQAVDPLMTEVLAPLRRVRAFSERMKLVALNASFAAARCGTDGAAFATITRELIALAQEDIALSTKVREVGQELTTAHHGITSLREGMVERLASMDDTSVSMLVRELRSSLGAMLSGIHSMGLRTDPVLAEVQTVMGEIQRQDIMRQGLDHVLHVVDELVASLDQLESLEDFQGAADAVAFELQAAALSRRLFLAIHEQIGGLLETVLGSTKKIRGVGIELTEAARKASDDGALWSPMHQLQESLGLMLRALESTMDEFDDSSRSFRQVEALARTLQRLLHSFEGNRAKLRTANLLMKLEISRTPSLAAALAITETLDQMRGKGHGGTEMEGVIERSVPLMNQRLRSSRQLVDQILGNRQKIADLREHYTGYISSMENSATSFRRRMDTALSTGEDVRSVGDQLLQKLDGIDAQLRQGSSIASTLERVAERIRRQTEALGIAELQESTDAADRIRRIANEFTILEHKVLAADGDDSPELNGDRGGELTLF